ncbi:MAG TPA: DJ-1/PfpI family protein [Rhizobium sp.]|nr:DJ-1/PfpI family protein [Rhizobium sp.]
MSRTILLWGGVILVVLAAAGFGGWMFSLPSATAAKAPPVPQAETDAVTAALRPFGHERPLIAVIGINDATETTDYVMPAGILRRADVADVVMLATGPGPVRLYPALEVESDMTVAEFDAAHPEGADYVIVPAMSRDDDPTAITWIRSQSEKGAKIIGVCAGAKVVAAAGLLDGKRATTHWYYLPEMLKRSPTTKYVANRRVVTDGNVVTTTGISASMPMTLTLVEAIAGRPKADAVAQDLGLDQWDLRHASDAFKVTRPFARTVLTNRMAFWKSEELGIRLEPGTDEVSLALVADAWSRTYRSTVTTLADTVPSVVTANGIRIVPDRVMTDWLDGRFVTTFPDQRPAAVLDRTLEAIATRYGEPTTDVVAMQLEYPRPH